MLLDQELAENFHVCPKCGHHFPMQARERANLLLDNGSFKEWDADIVSADPLKFPGYANRTAQEREKKSRNEAVITGAGLMEKMPVAIAIMDFDFLGGSMGSAVGEKITRCVERATSERRALIILSASGGARMHEGCLSLMQMAKISGAIWRHSSAGLPFISVLLDPTYGGVSASFATLGDLIIAEPSARIGFAGARVIQETTGQKLPPGFQSAEFLLQHGLLDKVVSRREMAPTISAFLRYFL
jgi:acetyl-CoA carboxylase carboxyl transferase subunit beta